MNTVNLRKPLDPAKRLPPAPPSYGTGMLSPYGSGPENKPARDWLAHLEAGRIGVRTPTDPAIAAGYEANARVFRAGAAR